MTHVTDIQEQLKYNALFEDLAPMADRKVAVVIGRFNPPTRGHYAVIDAVKKFIRQNKNLGLEASPVVVIIGGSKSDADKKKNPLSASEREMFMKASGHTNGVTFFIASNAYAAFSDLREKGYEPIAIAAGTDRIADYEKMLDRYFLTDEGQPIKHYAIHLARSEDAIEKDKSAKSAAMDKALHSAKESGSSIDINMVSGSLARRAVELGFEDEFAKIVGLESNPTLAKKMFGKIKSSITD